MTFNYVKLLIYEIKENNKYFKKKEVATIPRVAYIINFDSENVPHVKPE